MPIGGASHGRTREPRQARTAARSSPARTATRPARSSSSASSRGYAAQRKAAGLRAQLKASGDCAACSAGLPCTTCAEPQYKRSRGARGPASSSVSIPTAGGMPLPASLAAELGGRLGHPLDDVVVHAGGDAASAARSLHAEAFTVGSHIYFGEGRWRPDTLPGRELLAHELVHVIHQRGGGGAPRPAVDLEREADRAAATVARGGAVTDLSVGAAPAGRVQARDDDEIHADFEAMQAELATIESELAELNVKYGPYLLGQLPSSQALPLWESIKALERRKMILSVIEDMVIDEGTTGTQRIPRAIEQLFLEAEVSSYTEAGTIQYLMELSGKSFITPELEATILGNARYFPTVTMVLFDSILAAYAKEYRERKQNFDLALATLLARDKYELIKLFLDLHNRSDLALIASRFEHGVKLDRWNPGFIQLLWGANEVTQPQDLEYAVRHIYSSTGGDFPAPFDFLEGMLDNWYSYHLFNHLYGIVYDRRQLFELHGTTAIGAASSAFAGNAPYLNLEEMLKAAFGFSKIVSTRRGIGHERVPGSGVYNYPPWTKGGGNGYLHVYDQLKGVLDRWILGMSDWQRMKLAFGMYDMWGKIGRRLWDLVDLKTVLAIIGFALFIIGIQFVPFANILVDALLWWYFGNSVIAIIDMLASLIAAWETCSEAQGFLDVRRATRYLKDVDATAVDAMIDLVTFGAAKLWKYAKYAKSNRKPSFSKVEDVIEEDAIKNGPRQIRDAAKNAKAQKRTHDAWEDGLDPKVKGALEADEALAKAYRQMDPDVRKILTKCSADCIPIPAPTPAQLGRVKEMLERTGAKDHKGLKEYLKINRDRLDDALDALKGMDSISKVDDFIRTSRGLDDQISRYARDLGGDARFVNGRWEYTKPGSPPVAEYTITKYDAAPSSDKFFQSHHGVQGKWAQEQGLPRGSYSYDKQPGMLLRDSRSGTPHRFLTDRQAARAGGRANRTYARERELFQEDMQALRDAGFQVPKGVEADMLKQTDDYFRGVYKDAAGKLSNDRMKDIFGDWTPDSP